MLLRVRQLRGVRGMHPLPESRACTVQSCALSASHDSRPQHMPSRLNRLHFPHKKLGDGDWVTHSSQHLLRSVTQTRKRGAVGDSDVIDAGEREHRCVDRANNPLPLFFCRCCAFELHARVTPTAGKLKSALRRCLTK